MSMWLKEFTWLALTYAFVGSILAGIATLAFIFIARFSVNIIDFAGGEERLGLFVQMAAMLSGLLAAGVKTWSQFRK